MSDPAAQSPRPRITSRRIIKWLAYGIILLFFSVLLAVLSGTLIFIYWLQHGDLASAAGKAVYALTGVETAIDSLEVGAGGAVNARGIKIRTPAGLRVWVDSAGAKIRLGSLLKGKVTLADLSVTSPTISLAITPPSAPSPTPKPPSLEMPSFTVPAPVEVESFRMTDFLIEAHGKGLYAALGGVSLTAKGRAGPYGTNMTATLVTSEDSTLVWESGGKTIEISPRVISTVSLQESGDFTALVDSEIFMMDAPEKIKAGLPPRAKVSMRANGELAGLPSGTSSLSIWLDGEEALEATAALTEQEGTPAYEFSAKKLHIPLNRLAAAFVPEDVKVNGFAEMAPFSVKGLIPLDGKDPSADISGEGRLRLYYLSGFGLSLPEGARASLKFDGFRVSAAGYSGGFNGGASIPKLVKDGFSASGVFAKLDGKAASGNKTAKGEITVSLFAAGARDEKLALDGVKIWARAGGDFLTGDFPIFHLNLTAQENITVKAAGSFKKFGQSGLKIKTDFQLPFDTLAAIGPLRQSQVAVTGGQIAGSASVDGQAGDGFSAPRLDIHADTSFTGVSGSARSAGVELTSADGFLTAKLGLNSHWEAVNVSAKLSSKLMKLDVEKTAVMESVNLALAVSSPVIPGGVINADLNSTAERIFPPNHRGGDHAPEKAFAVDVAAVFDPAASAVNLEKGSVKIGSSTINGYGSYDMDQSGFKGGVSAESLDLRTVYAFLPPKARDSLKTQKLAGTLDFNVTGEGKLPKSWSDAGLAPPFDLAVSVKLKNGSFQSRELGVDAEKADINLKGDISKTALRLAGSAEVKRLKAKEYFGDMELDPSLTFDIESWKDKRIEARQFEFSAPRLGVSESLKGTIKGVSLQNLAQAMEKPGSLLPNLSMNIENRFSMSLDKKAATALDMNLEGGMAVNLSVTSTAKQDISVRGVTEFANLTAHSGGKLIVEQLNGRIPFAKTYLFDGVTETTPRARMEETGPAPSHGVRDSSFFESLRGAGARRDSVTATRMEAGFLTLRDLIMDVTFKETRLSMDYVKMSLLDGGLTGSVYMKGEKDHYSMRLSNVFAGLNMAKLFEDGAGLAGREAEVDGAMDVSLGLKKGVENEDIDLARLEISLTLSRIGAKALEKVLLFIDPKESSPAVMNARSLLKYASPEKVEIVTRHGALSVTVDMKYTPALGGQTASMPIMKRAPMNRLVNFGVIKDWSKKLSPLVALLRHVGATTISVDKKGALVFR